MNMDGVYIIDGLYLGMTGMKNCIKVTQRFYLTKSL